MSTRPHRHDEQESPLPPPPRALFARRTLANWTQQPPQPNNGGPVPPLRLHRAAVTNFDVGRTPPAAAAAAAAAAPPQRRTRSLPHATSRVCLCQGAWDSHNATHDPCPDSVHGQVEHYVWFAFLHIETQDYRQEQWLRDYRVLPTNWLTTKLSRSPLYHVQIMFYCHARRNFLTFSVDAYYGRVRASESKQFNSGWTFARVRITHNQECAMHQFLEAQLDKPFNEWGAYTLFFWPRPTTGDSWFCSQLCVSTLHAAGLLLDTEPGATSPAALYDTLHRSGEVQCEDVRHPLDRLHVMLRVRRVVGGDAAASRQ